MSDEKKDALQVRQPTQLVRGQAFRFIPSSLGEAMELAAIIAKSDMCPKAYKDRPNDILVAYEHGAALGLSWLQSLSNVAVINGRPGIYGDAIPALVMATGECTRFHSPMPEDGQPAICIIGRKGYPDEFKATFSEADAKKAGLWGKSGPWTNYPKRMLQMRARAFCVRDAFPDKLMGLGVVEELQDIPAIDAQVISSEVVTDPLDGVSEGLRASIEKGFDTLSMSQAQRLVQINQFFIADRSKDDSATALLEWLKDEYAKRKGGGKPRVKKDADNGKKVAETPASSQGGDASAQHAGSAVPDPATQPAKPAVESAEIAETVAEKPKDDAEFLF